MTTSTGPEPAPTATYAAAYNRLAAIAAKLKQTGSATTIDTLAEDVRAARDAYAVCRDRLAAIRRDVDEALGADEDDASNS